MPRSLHLVRSAICLVALSGTASWTAAQPVPSEPHRKPPMSTPSVQVRNRLPYVAVRAQASMDQLNKVIPNGIGEVFAWLQKEHVSPAGPPFVRYLVIDMPKRLDMEIGVPVAKDLHASGRVHSGALPAGRYASVVYVGDPSGLGGAHMALQSWAGKHGLKLSAHETPKGAAYDVMLETYSTDPKAQPDRTKWRTEIAYLVVDRHSVPGKNKSGKPVTAAHAVAH